MGYVEDLRAKVGHTPLILVGVAVLVFNNQNEILLQQKQNGVWAIPGGFMELEESAEEAGRREILEETGLLIGRMHLLDVFSGKEHHVKLDNGDEFYPVTLAYFTKDITGGTLAADGSEGIEVKFFSLNELPEGFNPKIKELLLKNAHRFGVNNQS